MLMGDRKNRTPGELGSGLRFVPFNAWCIVYCMLMGDLTAEIARIAGLTPWVFTFGLPISALRCRLKRLTTPLLTRGATAPCRVARLPSDIIGNHCLVDPVATAPGTDIVYARNPRFCVENLLRLGKMLVSSPGATPYHAASVAAY